jgi:hypothetical protein
MRNANHRVFVDRNNGWNESPQSTFRHAKEGFDGKQTSDIPVGQTRGAVVKIFLLGAADTSDAE